MIKHVVMFKLKAFETPEQKQEKMHEIKTRLEALIDLIEPLKAIRVDFNLNPEETWDLILTTELPTLEDVRHYANHPAHVAVADGKVRPYTAVRSCLDFEE